MRLDGHTELAAGAPPSDARPSAEPPSRARRLLAVMRVAVPAALASYCVLRAVVGPWLWPLCLIEPLLWWVCLPSFVLLVLAACRHRMRTAALHGVIVCTWTWLFGGDVLPREVPSAPAALHVLSFNLAADLAEPERVVALLREFSADLVLLQELGPRQGMAIEQGLADLYPHRDLHPLGIDGRGLLSRHPILEAGLEPAPPLRAVQRALVDIDGQRVTVLNVHADLLHTWLLPFTGGLDRLEQLAEEALRASPVIVGGDFNATANMEAYRRLRRTGLQDVLRPALHGPAFTFPAFGRYRGLPLPPMARIDTIWCCDAFAWSTARVLPAAGSDHRPVLAGIRWR